MVQVELSTVMSLAVDMEVMTIILRTLSRLGDIQVLIILSYLYYGQAVYQETRMS